MFPQVQQRIKEATGIEVANCSTCAHLGSDGDGGEPEYAVDWAVCDRYPGRHNLKSFPFKKEMACWQPEFWWSKFADEATYEEGCPAVDRFLKAIEDAKYPQLTNVIP